MPPIGSSWTHSHHDQRGGRRLGEKETVTESGVVGILGFDAYNPGFDKYNPGFDAYNPGFGHTIQDWTHAIQDLAHLIWVDLALKA